MPALNIFVLIVRRMSYKITPSGFPPPWVIPAFSEVVRKEMNPVTNLAGTLRLHQAISTADTVGILDALFSLTEWTLGKDRYGFFSRLRNYDYFWLDLVGYKSFVGLFSAFDRRGFSLITINYLQEFCGRNDFDSLKSAQL